ncbi:30S ribosomal protein S8 [Stratiformator vulcanicus]|uniref:Small ribosomal subunit protein uS8 n=1 Tax=Stratiformator vulcanicus TaxID=2527980 RepID=A0A517R0W0_9PLAN|nr:30S ribosomal protein S8 [Stratiformator vulcanicus]QDT37511.1 30S ribosomal protein S8 [Stratiformator vulcanicus]
MMTDPIADMLTRIRNAVSIEKPYVDIPTSKVKVGIAEVLKREGYVWDYEVVEDQPRNVLRIRLKYGANGERVIQAIERESKPGRRQYVQVRDTPRVLNGLGIAILSTSKGILSGREARRENVGGELLCTVY